MLSGLLKSVNGPPKKIRIIECSLLYLFSDSWEDGIVDFVPKRRGENMADVTFTDQNFESDVIKADKPVLVDFWAEWCVPCRVQGPIIEEIAKEFAGSAVVGKLNVDENGTVAQQYGVMSIPTIMIFKSGQMVKQFVGVQSKDTLVAELKNLS